MCVCVQVKAFHNIVAARTLREGVQNLLQVSCDYDVCVCVSPIVVTMVCVYCTCVPLQLSGLGKIRPNTLVVGFKNNWTTCTDSEIQEYVALLQ